MQVRIEISIDKGKNMSSVCRKELNNAEIKRIFRAFLNSIEVFPRETILRDMQGVPVGTCVAVDETISEQPSLTQTMIDTARERYPDAIRFDMVFCSSCGHNTLAPVSETKCPCCKSDKIELAGYGRPYYV